MKGFGLKVARFKALHSYSARFDESFKAAILDGAKKSGCSNRKLNQWYSSCIIELYDSWIKEFGLQLGKVGPKNIVTRLGYYDPTVSNSQPMKISINNEANEILILIIEAVEKSDAKFKDLKTRIFYTAILNKLNWISVTEKK
jgi:hypothetical protein